MFAIATNVVELWSWRRQEKTILPCMGLAFLFFFPVADLSAALPLCEQPSLREHLIVSDYHLLPCLHLIVSLVVICYHVCTLSGRARGRWRSVAGKKWKLGFGFCWEKDIGLFKAQFITLVWAEFYSWRSNTKIGQKWLIFPNYI